LRGVGADVAGRIGDQAAVVAEVKSLATSTSAIAPMSAPQRVKYSNIKTQVKDFGYITGCHVYPNSTGVCGWVAGSMVVRYWHVRSSTRTLLPSAYRVGWNLNPNKNFATYLQGSSGTAAGHSISRRD
jgi:hypothetical protein